MLSLFMRLMIACLLLSLSACGHVLSEQALSSVDTQIDYNAVRADPSSHRGETLLLGGEILTNTVTEAGTTLEILRYRLDRRGWPRGAVKPGDRFLARSDEVLDPALFAKGKTVTLTGTVVGSETRALDQARYLYPVFVIGEISLWSEEGASRGPYPHPFPYRINPYDPGVYYPYGHPYWYPRPYPR